jgi:hypothetical protein
MEIDSYVNEQASFFVTSHKIMTWGQYILLKWEDTSDIIGT